MLRSIFPISTIARHSRIALLTTAAALGIAMMAGPARADIIFTPGNHPGPNEETIQFGSHFTNLQSLVGFTNQSNVPIIFSLINGAMNGETEIGTDASGQADIVCNGTCGTYAQGGANGNQLTDLEIRVGGGFGATDFIGNLDFGEGSVNINVTDQMGAVFAFALGNGQNFFTLNAINGEVITDIQITELSDDGHGHFGWNDFKQPRISGLCTLQGDTCTPITITQQTPEPSSLSLVGASLFAAGWFVRRRKARSQV